MANTQGTIKDEELLGRLKDILLWDDRKELEEIKQILNTRADLAQRVSPIIEEHLEHLKLTFSDDYKEIVNKLIETKLKNSQEEIVNSLYPSLGRMIKKYINHQLQLLKENIDTSVKSTFSGAGIKRRFKSIFTGVDESELIISTANQYTIQEIFLIERDSGLLMGSASLHTTFDQDVVAGMLTAIKAFVEDAFKKEKQELEFIEYGNYKIVIQTFFSYYMAAAIDGSMSTSEKFSVEESMHDFASAELTGSKSLELKQELISQKLHNYFIKKDKD